MDRFMGLCEFQRSSAERSDGRIINCNWFINFRDSRGACNCGHMVPWWHSDDMHHLHLEAMQPQPFGPQGHRRELSVRPPSCAVPVMARSAAACMQGSPSNMPAVIKCCISHVMSHRLKCLVRAGAP